MFEFRRGDFVLVLPENPAAGDKFLYGVVRSALHVLEPGGEGTFSYGIYVPGRVFTSYYRGSDRLVFLSTKGFTEMRLWANRA